MISNELDCVLLMQELEKIREQELRSQHSGTASLHNSLVSCSGFISANPNDQIQYAVETGILANDGGVAQ